MDGYEATRRIRLARNTVPILALTASAVKGVEEICKASGITSYLTKPIRIDALEAAILKHVQ